MEQALIWSALRTEVRRLLAPWRGWCCRRQHLRRQQAAALHIALEFWDGFGEPFAHDLLESKCLETSDALH